MTTRFAVPGRCDDCGAPTGAAVRCPTCGLLQVGQVADDLRVTLERADQILLVLRSHSVTAPAPAPPAAATPPAGSWPPEPARTRPRGLPAASVPAILLALGSLCVLVAAVVFLTVAWSDLSLAWRTTAMLAVTGVAAVSAGWSVRRALRGAAESLALVTCALVVLDLYAGHGAGLGPLAALDGAGVDWLVAAVTAALGVGWAVWARTTPVNSLVGVQVASALALAAMVRLVAITWEAGFDWLGAVLVVTAGPVAFVLAALRLRVAAAAAAGLAALGWAVLLVLGLLRAVGTTTAGEMYLQLQGLPVLVASVVAALPAVTRVVPVPLRTAAATAAVGGPAAVFVLSVRGLGIPASAILAGAVAVGLGAAARHLALPWSHAVRVVGLLALVLPAIVTAVAVESALGRLGTAPAGLWADALGSPLTGPTGIAGPWSVVAITIVSALGAGLVALGSRRTAALCLVGGTVGGATTGMLLTDWPVSVLATALTVGAVLALLAPARGVSALPVLTIAALVGLGAAVAVRSPILTGLLLPVQAAALLLAASRVRAVVGTALTAAGTLASAAAVAAWAHLAGGAAATVGLTLLVVVGVLAAVSQGLALRGGSAWRRLGLESAAAVVAFSGAALAAQEPGASRVVAFGLLAAVTGGVAATTSDRRLLACPAVLFVAGVAFEVVLLAGGQVAWASVAVGGVAVLTALTAQVPGLRQRADLRVLRPVLEATAVFAGMLSVLGSLGAALALTVALSTLGAGAVAVSFASADRRRVAWAGSVLLLLASWFRLSSLEVTLVEAYSLPGALSLLVAGLVWMRRTPTATSWQALGTPLVFAVGPSLAVALQQPTSVRALLTGLAGVLLVAAAVRRHWGAPLLVGGATVALLALVNVAPYAAGLPRWALFGAVGVVMLAVGVTWERRRHELVVLQRYAARLR